MAFEPGLGDAAHERVPGGRLVIGAYTAAIALLGAYVAYVARRASRLEDNLRRLEDDMTRRGGGGDP
jgi:CcmD family protein